MLTRDDADRIANAITALRATWNHQQLMAVMGDDRIRLRRTAKDVAAALAWLALDPDTRQPTRLFEAGAWWATTEPRHAPLKYRSADPTDCATCGRPKGRCIDDEHEYEPAHARSQGVPRPKEGIR